MVRVLRRLGVARASQLLLVSAGADAERGVRTWGPLAGSVDEWACPDCGLVQRDAELLKAHLPHCPHRPHRPL